MAQMEECPVCHGNCDPGEIVGNKCPECRELEMQMRARDEHAFKVMISPLCQMDLMEMLREGADG